jgi:predicted RND superfamily exporter protein
MSSRDIGAAGVLGRFIGDAPPSHEAVMLGSVTFIGEPGSPDAVKLEALQERLKSLPDARLTGWESLGNALSKLVRGEIMRLTIPLVLVLIIMLTLTFKNVRDILLSIGVLSLGVAALMATMSLLGQSWNLASLAALPLLLGTGIDYGIHIMLSMAREDNDIRKVRSTTGKAVFFSGATTVIGFSSLMFAGNQGIASLGTACCIGTSWILLFVLWLLPHWRVWICRSKP